MDAAADHVPRPYPGKVVVFWPAEEPEPVDEARRWWRRISPLAEVETVRAIISPRSRCTAGARPSPGRPSRRRSVTPLLTRRGFLAGSIAAAAASACASAPEPIPAPPPRALATPPTSPGRRTRSPRAARGRTAAAVDARAEEGRARLRDPERVRRLRRLVRLSLRVSDRSPGRGGRPRVVPAGRRAPRGELLLRWADSVYQARGYECLWSFEGDIDIVRWNGPPGDFNSIGAAEGRLGRRLMTATWCAPRSSVPSSPATSTTG